MSVVFSQEKRFLGYIALFIGLVAVTFGLVNGISGNVNDLEIALLGAIIIALVVVFLRPSADNNVASDAKAPLEDADNQPAAAEDAKNTDPSPSPDSAPEPSWKDLTNLEKAIKILGILIIIGGLIFAIKLALDEKDPFKGLAIIGLGSFVVMLAGAFCLSERWDLKDGEFRKALTVSITSVYFYSLAFADVIKVTNTTTATNSSVLSTTTASTVTSWTIVEPLFNNLWAVVLLIIGFYFATNWINSLNK
jgi:hypothetical protein